MKLKLYKINDSSFGFFFEGKSKFLSCLDLSKLTSFVKPNYSNIREASRDAREVVKHHDYLLRLADYEAEGNNFSEDQFDTMMIDSFINIYKNLSQRIKGASSQSNEEEQREMQDSHQVLTIITNEIEAIIKNLTPDDEQSRRTIEGLKEIHDKMFVPLFNEYFGGLKANVDPQVLQKLFPEKEKGGLGGGLANSLIGGIYKISGNTVEKESIDDDLKYEMMETYAERACLAIEAYHNNVYSQIDSGKIELLEDGDPIISIHVNKDMVVTNIMPKGKVARLYPFYSVEFYQKYWKPIVESIHNFYIEGQNLIIFANNDEFSLPDTPNSSKSHRLMGWDTNLNKHRYVDLSFKGKNPTVWLISDSKKQVEKNQEPRLREQDFFNAIVQCIDKNLDTLHGKVGRVVQVIPLVDGLEVDVNFIDDLDSNSESAIRLHENQVRILNDDQIQGLQFLK